jgi:hypothetical protein
MSKLNFIGDRRGEGFFALAFGGRVPVTESCRPRDTEREFQLEAGGVKTRLLRMDVKSGTAPPFVFSLSSLCFWGWGVSGRTCISLV